MNDKEIEEMAKEIWRSEILCNTCGESTYTYCGEAIAELLYNAGYRKIPENAVVLTREEYKKKKKHLQSVLELSSSQFEEVVKENEKLKNTVENLRANLKRNDEHLHIRIKEQARKETAREILIKGKQLVEKWLSKDDEKVGFIFDFEKFIKEQYGVDLGE